MRWACLALALGASDGGHPKALGRDEAHKGARIGKPAHNMCDEDLERGCWPRLAPITIRGPMPTSSLSTLRAQRLPCWRHAWREAAPVYSKQQVRAAGAL